MGAGGWCCAGRGRATARQADAFRRRLKHRHSAGAGWRASARVWVAPTWADTPSPKVDRYLYRPAMSGRCVPTCRRPSGSVSCAAGDGAPADGLSARCGRVGMCSAGGAAAPVGCKRTQQQQGGGKSKRCSDAPPTLASRRCTHLQHRRRHPGGCGCRLPRHLRLRRRGAARHPGGGSQPGAG